MKKLTRGRMLAFLLIVSMILSMFGFDCRAEANEAEGQTDGAVELAVPQNVREENGFIVWDEVENAYGYTIQASKGEEKWTYNWYENRIEWNRFIYEHCPEREFGNYAFEICAFDETVAATEFSSSVTVSYQATLSMPENMVISESNNPVLSWDKVEGAVRYNIRIFKNDDNHSLYYDTYDRNGHLNWRLDEVGEYLVTVQAMDKDYHVSGWTEEVLMKKVVEQSRCCPSN